MEHDHIYTQWSHSSIENKSLTHIWIRTNATKTTLTANVTLYICWSKIEMNKARPDWRWDIHIHSNKCKVSYDWTGNLTMCMCWFKGVTWYAVAYLVIYVYIRSKANINRLTMRTHIYMNQDRCEWNHIWSSELETRSHIYMHPSKCN